MCLGRRRRPAISTVSSRHCNMPATRANDRENISPAAPLVTKAADPKGPAVLAWREQALQLRRKPWPRWSTSWTSVTSVAGAILVNAPTLVGWYLLQGQAVAISRTTGIYALMFSSLSRQGERCEIGVARI